MHLLSAINGFFFRPVSASGFGLMRVFWASTVLLCMLTQWADIAYFYSNEGILPTSMEHLMMRSQYRFSIFNHITDPSMIFAIYLAFLGSLIMMMTGLLPRIATIASVILLFSFHERMPFILGGGDTLLRNTGFLLMIAPCIEAFSLKRLRMQFAHWKKTRTYLPAPAMPIWPYRLLLWQMIILYATSAWYKLLGDMWTNGTAVGAALHHPVFARFPRAITDYLMPVTPIVNDVSMFWEGAWLLLLIPALAVHPLQRRFPRSKEQGSPGWAARFSLKRWLMAGGVLFHGSIFILMDAGSFALSVFTAYAGLMLEPDWKRLKDLLNRKKQPNIAVLFDGRCGLCLRSIFALKLLDVLGRLQPIDFRNPSDHQKIAPDISFENLDRAMHIRYLGTGATFKGFDAFRELCWELPALWLLVPFLYLPGATFIGRRIYGQIARRRVRCTHEGCAL